MALLKPVTNQLQDKHGRAEDWARREGEEEERLITTTAHAQCGSGEGGVVLLESVCMYMQGGGGMKQGVGGCLTPFLFLRPRGITRCLYCISAPHDLQIFFSSSF